MKQIFKPHFFRSIIIILSLLLLVKLVWIVVAWLWLPTDGIDHAQEKGVKALYCRVKLTPNKASAPARPTKKPAKKGGNIDDIVLLAIYNASDTTVVTVKHKGKTKVLSRGDEIDGFELRGAGRDFATFVKGEKSYKAMLIKTKGKNTTPSYAQNSQNSTLATNDKVSGEIVDAGDRKIVDRSLVEHYAKNMDDIYKNIGIGELKQEGNLKGFQITFVRKDSPFAKLGVQRGDIIKSINGQEINSYNAAFGVYRNIGNLENLTLVIQRGNEEMELEYEIN